ncbi:MAG TPA: hypothetical protein VFT22_07405 [Kofleriaceae bacterium]|nr:hypothetical protein [Kofleriaceae bacterium]
MTFQKHLPRGGVTSASSPSACSSSRVLPWVDVGFISAEVGAGAAGFLIHAGVFGGHDHEDVGTIVTGVALAVAVVQGASAGNGFRRAAECGQLEQPSAATTTAAR